MMVLITYDVETLTPSGQKRLRKVAKACQDYGQRVQNSVFECLLTESQFVSLKARINSIIDEKLDSVRFYHMGNGWQKHVESIGKVTSFDYTNELII